MMVVVLLMGWRLSRLAASATRWRIVPGGMVTVRNGIGERSRAARLANGEEILKT